MTGGSLENLAPCGAAISRELPRVPRPVWTAPPGAQPWSWEIVAEVGAVTKVCAPVEIH
jgi:hypothetical protein